MATPATGRPTRARDRLRNNFIFALAEDFDAHGAKAIELARIDDPLGYVKVCASLMPKEVELTRPLDDIPDEQLDAAILAVQAIFAAQSEPGAVAKDTGGRAKAKAKPQPAKDVQPVSQTG